MAFTGGAVVELVAGSVAGGATSARFTVRAYAVIFVVREFTLTRGWVAGRRLAVGIGVCVTDNRGTFERNAELVVDVAHHHTVAFVAVI